MADTTTIDRTGGTANPNWDIQTTGRKFGEAPDTPLTVSSVASAATPPVSSVTGANSVATPPPVTSVTPPPPTMTPLTQATQPTSVVDVLNKAGQPSSFADRQKLAEQYGIQGYKGTAQQNQQLAAKFIQAHAQAIKQPPPQTSSDGRAAVSDIAGTQTPDPQQSFFDAYASLNPVMKTMYDMIQNALSPSATQTSFVDQYNKLTKEQGIPQIQTELLNVNNVMLGTEDDIRTEISKAGGFATESQVQALAATRNKVLIKQATALSNVLQMKEDYVNQVMNFTQADRTQVNTEIDRKIGLVEKMATIQDTINKNAQTNYQKIVDQVGYSGLAKTFANNPQGRAYAEAVLGLPGGSLSDQAWLSNAETYRQQQLALGAQRVQISLNTAGSLNTYRQARTLSADASAVNGVIRSLYPAPANNPINLYNSANAWIGNVDAAYAKSIDPKNANKGPSDLELLDAAVKLNNGGQQITQVQVDELTSAISFRGRATVVGGKITGISGIIDDGTRTAIKNLAHANLTQKTTKANQAIDIINKQLSSVGFTQNLDLPAIAAMSNTNVNNPTNWTKSGTLQDGTAVHMDTNGNIYDDQGNQYDEAGNQIN